MSTLTLFILLPCAGIVLVRCVCVAAKMSHREWEGHPLQFYGITASYALTGGGAVGMALGMVSAPVLLLIGVALWVVFDRRRGHC